MAASGEVCAQVELPSGARLKLGRLKLCTTVAVLKNRIEQQAGILSHTYSLTYLDAAPLDDGRTLEQVDVVDGATLRVVSWGMWHELVSATLRGDVKTCLVELRALGNKGDAQWRNYCGWCTLYTSAHAGHYVLLCDLLKEWATVNVNEQSPCGWTAFHAAARMGRWKALCVLVDNGADVTLTDKGGRTAADLAHSNRHKRCEQSLRFCEWNIKKRGIMRERLCDYDADKERNAATHRAHQYTDSSHPRMWLSGPRGTEYMTHTPNPVSVRDVADFRARHPPTRQPQAATGVKGEVSSPALSPAEATATTVRGTRSKFDYGWFDKLRAQQLVPTTHHILTYSDPSSTSLQPRSLLNPNGYVKKSKKE